jgi:hypothetical protein
MEKHVFESNNGMITVTPTTVTIHHKKGSYHGGKTKEIRIKSISGIEMGQPGKIFAGYIQFMFSGGSEAGGWSRIDAAKNENCIMFRKNKQAMFEECRDLVNRYIEESQSSSGKEAAATSEADELAKWAALKESGAITADEYETKKRQILGL